MIIAFLHTYTPSPVLVAFGPVNVYWYGFLYAVAIVLGYWLTVWRLRVLSSSDTTRAAMLRHELIDLTFGLVVSGIIGARLYHVANEFSYYLASPWKIFALWEGGLAIHGALIGGALYLWWYASKKTIPFLWLSDLIAPAMLLGQAIGRWGNYFNQELFGRPTGLPWGIPIDLFHRPAQFPNSLYFHPTFLYESLWDFASLIFLLLIARHKNLTQGTITWLYLLLVSIGRILVELLRVDETPMIGPLRLPFLVAIAIALFASTMLLTRRRVYLA